MLDRLPDLVAAVRLGVEGKRFLDKGEDWSLPSIEELIAMGNEGREILILTGVQAFGMRQADSAALASLTDGVNAMLNFFRDATSAGYRPGGSTAPTPNPQRLPDGYYIGSDIPGRPQFLVEGGRIRVILGEEALRKAGVSGAPQPVPASAIPVGFVWPDGSKT